MRRKTLVLFYIWFSISTAYYGLSLNSGNLGKVFSNKMQTRGQENILGGNIFVNFLISGLVEVPGYGGAMWLMNWQGRRVPFAASLAFCGMLLISIMGADWLPMHGHFKVNYAQ